MCAHGNPANDDWPSAVDVLFVPTESVAIGVVAVVFVELVSLSPAPEAVNDEGVCVVSDASALVSVVEDVVFASVAVVSSSVGVVSVVCVRSSTVGVVSVFVSVVSVVAFSLPTVVFTLLVDGVSLVDVVVFIGVVFVDVTFVSLLEAVPLVAGAVTSMVPVAEPLPAATA